MLDQHDLDMITSVVCNAVQPLLNEVDALKMEVETLKEDVAHVKAQNQKLEAGIQNIQFVLDDNIISGIKIIGEGQATLARNFQQSLCSAQYDEMIKLSVWSLEHEIHKLGKKLDAFAG